MMFSLAKAGFLAMAIPLLFTTMLYAGGRKLWVIAGISAVFPIIVNFGVWEIFTVKLP